MNVRELMELLKDIPPETPVESHLVEWGNESDCEARLSYDGETAFIEAKHFPSRPTPEEREAELASRNPETFKQWQARTGFKNNNSEGVQALLDKMAHARLGGEDTIFMDAAAVGAERLAASVMEHSAMETTTQSVFSPPDPGLAHHYIRASGVLDGMPVSKRFEWTGPAIPPPPDPGLAPQLRPVETEPGVFDTLNKHYGALRDAAGGRKEKS